MSSLAPCVRHSRVPLAVLAIVGAGATAQAPRYLNNGADIVYLYGDPSVAGDLYWMVWPRQTLIAPSGQIEVSALRFDLYDTDWTTPPNFYDFLVGPGVTNALGVIEPDLAS